MADLIEAAALVPDTWSATDYGRASKGVALAYQARANLYEASWQKYHEGNQSRANELFQAAANAAQGVIDLNAYSLHPDFRELFTYAGEQSDEIRSEERRVGKECR